MKWTQCRVDASLGNIALMMNVINLRDQLGRLRAFKKLMIYSERSTQHRIKHFSNLISPLVIWYSRKGTGGTIWLETLAPKLTYTTAGMGRLTISGLPGSLPISVDLWWKYCLDPLYQTCKGISFQEWLATKLIFWNSSHQQVCVNCLIHFWALLPHRKSKITPTVYIYTSGTCPTF